MRALTEGRDYRTVDREDGPVVAVATQANAAAFLGISVRALQRWLAEGAPGKPGEYVVADLLWWRTERDAGRPVCRCCGRAEHK